MTAMTTTPYDFALPWDASAIQRHLFILGAKKVEGDEIEYRRRERRGKVGTE